jgi:hypothetical protein
VSGVCLAGVQRTDSGLDVLASVPVQGDEDSKIEQVALNCDEFQGDAFNYDELPTAIKQVCSGIVKRYRTQFLDSIAPNSLNAEVDALLLDMNSQCARGRAKKLIAQQYGAAERNLNCANVVSGLGLHSPGTYETLLNFHRINSQPSSYSALRLDDRDLLESFLKHCSTQLGPELACFLVCCKALAKRLSPAEEGRMIPAVVAVVKTALNELWSGPSGSTIEMSDRLLKSTAVLHFVCQLKKNEEETAEHVESEPSEPRPQVVENLDQNMFEEAPIVRGGGITDIKQNPLKEHIRKMLRRNAAFNALNNQRKHRVVNSLNRTITSENRGKTLEGLKEAATEFVNNSEELNRCLEGARKKRN